MSLNFQLIRNEKPVPLAKIDKELCDSLGYRESDNSFLFGWVDLVGLEIAFTGDFKSSYEKYEDDKEMVEIINYLENNFQVRNWRE